VANATDSRQPTYPPIADHRQVARIARSAALGVYGVTAVVGTRWYERLAERLGIGNKGVAVRTTPTLDVTLNVELAPGVPREKVLTNVADAVRYTVQRDAGRAIDALTVTVEGM